MSALGWLLDSRLNPKDNRLVRALCWAVFATIGYFLAELICLGSPDKFTPVRVVFWASLGAFIGILLPQRSAAIRQDQKAEATQVVK
jgi:hypothetical protein